MASPKPRWFIHSLFFLCLNIPFSSFASDQFSFDNSLSGNQTISSQGDKFELGFFQLGNKYASANYYLGQQRIVSWKNSDDPAEGIFSLEIDPNGSSKYFIFWNRSKQYWSSGDWNGKFFTNVLEMNPKYLYNFEYVPNENETYFTYSLQDDSMISRFVMDLSGQIKLLKWLEESQQWILLWTQPQAQCDVYALCGPFGSCDQMNLPYCSCLKSFKEVNSIEWECSDSSEGCQRNSPLKCSVANSSSPNGETDQFFDMSSISLPDNPQILNITTIQVCNAFAFSSNNFLVWYGNLLNLQETDGSGDTLYLRLSASPSSQTT
ncbi:hypothetical protein LUZ61_012174 [Rhynchospora tenuis]|uniref:non-specific serine/threonine protein kinase n=1 Tax=Rhynchospora tenuis TaxID=198213 RepID=A0AAD6A2E2_9POAL|nr:hypothetical protein LUZ61_012174 [Rhynchospora tenuis]